VTRVAWKGHVLSIQPRIRLLRSFDQRWHTYLGYVVTVGGRLDGEEQEFRVAIGPGAQKKQLLRVGDAVDGESEPVSDADREVVQLHKTVKLRVTERAVEQGASPPPWHGVPPALETYRARGHRRLAEGTYQAACASCMWACRMPVEMIIDQWNPEKKKYRFETFCYGPKSCRLYRAGPTRKVPGRRGMLYEEESWVDEEQTAHRKPDE
jgi:hypothetical protein